MSMENSKTILVIEDDDLQRELLRMTLGKRGYSVLTAENGIEGYDQALATRPDLIVTDISMPGADGLHLVRHVRDTTEIAGIPILVMTGYGTGKAAYSLALGADGYEPKPLNPESFVASVNRLLSQSPESAARESHAS